MDNIQSKPSRFRTGMLFVTCVFTCTTLVEACLWDWDTLQMERRRYPGVVEMITGKFVRHSPAYYEWRIQDRTPRLYRPAENPDIVDDLAVAYSKLGQHSQAIALLEQALEAHPERYETLSNLGTIHMLAGDLKTGKTYIDRAIVINPDAHFGREKYQSLLAEYFLTARPPLHDATNASTVKHGSVGFARFVLGQRTFNGQSADETESEKQFNAAQQGVLGMMHFANYDSPFLLEALGDLLISSPNEKDHAEQLAARAYYRIAQLSDDEAKKKEFTEVARNCVMGSFDYIKFRGESDDKEGRFFRDSLEKLVPELDGELAVANAYVAVIAADEEKWINQGVNVDREFAAKYYDSLDRTIEDAKTQLSRERRDVRGNPQDVALVRGIWIFAGIVTAVIIAIVSICWYFRRRFERIRQRI